MSPHGVKILLLVVVTFVDAAFAADCTSYRSNGNLEIADNVECTLSSGFTVSEFTVHGTVRITAANLVTIQAETIDIKPGARIIADGITGSGTGRGTSLGSGGALYTSISFLLKMFVLY